jgi:acylphosphatase
MALKSVHLVIEGRVQGVFFRQSMKKVAVAYGVSGWVKNLPSGEVEALVQGEDRAVDNVVEWCKSGPDRAYVENVSVAELEPVDNLAGFRVTG